MFHKRLRGEAGYSETSTRLYQTTRYRVISEDTAKLIVSTLSTIHWYILRSLYSRYVNTYIHLHVQSLKLA